MKLVDTNDISAIIRSIVDIDDISTKGNGHAK
jgi:hypothetical protein